MTSMPTPTPFAQFDNSYARLDERFFVRLNPRPVAAPQLIRLNRDLAKSLGIELEGLAASDLAQIFSGNRIPPGAEPIATAYAGHQFGGFSPQLGDGRAILLGEIIASDGHRFDMQLKGSGPTPFSRRGDGRAALGPVLREYIVSEAMAALGVPTTRALAAVTTGEQVLRETPLPGAIITRIAQSHIRVGTFQYFAVRRDVDALRELADHVIARHYPNAARAEQPYLALLESVMQRQADLIARWMLVGFIHGVMNTDNCAVSGETIDYGPCAFMDDFDPAQVFSSIDAQGRYAYANQPAIAQWNVTRFAETLLPLISDDTAAAIASAQVVLDGYGPRFTKRYAAGLRAKLGLATEQSGDLVLGQDLLDCMARNKADFTLTFRALADAAIGNNTAIHALFADVADYETWASRWHARLALEPTTPSARRTAMRAINPAIIPRNHNIEAAIAAAVSAQDFSLFNRLVDALEKPFDDHPENVDLTLPPRPDEVVRATFCGT
jgi:serine/tyrosine/threonine adenylyltransferase